MERLITAMCRQMVQVFMYVKIAIKINNNIMQSIVGETIQIIK